MDGAEPRRENRFAIRAAAGNNGAVTPADTLEPAVADLLKRDSAGLVTAVVQQYDTGEVLMVGWMNDAALQRHADHRPDARSGRAAGRSSG